MECGREARNEGESERVGLGDVCGVLSLLQAIGSKQEVAKRVLARRGQVLAPILLARGGRRLAIRVRRHEGVSTEMPNWILGYMAQCVGS